jgi:hypothetical protein
MTVACVAIYSMMFAVGYWIYGKVPLASMMTVISVIAGCALCPILKKLNLKGE